MWQTRAKLSNRQLSQRCRKHFIIGPATKWARPEGPRDWVFWEGVVPHPHQLKGLGERFELPQQVRAEPRRQVILWQFQVKKAGLLIAFHEVLVTISTT